MYAWGGLHKMVGNTVGTPCTGGLIMTTSTLHEHTPSVSPSVSLIRTLDIGDLNLLVPEKTLCPDNAMSDAVHTRSQMSD